MCELLKTCRSGQSSAARDATRWARVASVELALALEGEGVTDHARVELLVKLLALPRSNVDQLPLEVCIYDEEEG